MELSFNRRIYRKAALEEAIGAFADFAEIGYVESGGRYQVTIAPKAAAEGSDEAGELADEFANYLLRASLEG